MLLYKVGSITDGTVIRRYPDTDGIYQLEKMQYQ